MWVLHTRPKTATPKPVDTATDDDGLCEVRETVHVKVTSRAAGRATVSKAKSSTPPKAAAVPVEDAEENPFL